MRFSGRYEFALKGLVTGEAHCAWNAVECEKTVTRHSEVFFYLPVPESASKARLSK